MKIAIKTALISVFHKDGLDEIVKALHANNVNIISTGGTKKFITELGIPCTGVENITDFPEILDGRVKTLHPKVFGGILARRNEVKDEFELSQHKIEEIDLVIVDLYPFRETVAAGASEQDIIEKIDIGGIALIRATAKNHEHAVIVPSMHEYASFLSAYNQNEGRVPVEFAKDLAKRAFEVSSEYDASIHQWFAGDTSKALRYGENPHQKGFFDGNLDELFDKHQGKELSYNNILDIDSALGLLEDFEVKNGSTFIVMKHNNACGVATRRDTYQAYKDALAGDPVSAFGGVLCTNTEIDEKTADEMKDLFFEVLIAPSYTQKALEILSDKKNRIILQLKALNFKTQSTRTALNGQLIQDRNTHVDTLEILEDKTTTAATTAQKEDLLFALKVAKHTKSNTIVLAKDKQLLASGTGQTSRVDALNQAIDKAARFGFDLNDSVMASDAFFPFADCVEIADKSGVKAIVQPGGSIRDKASIAYCNENDIAMVFTGIRHFKH